MMVEGRMCRVTIIIKDLLCIEDSVIYLVIAGLDVIAGSEQWFTLMRALVSATWACIVHYVVVLAF